MNTFVPKLGREFSLIALLSLFLLVIPARGQQSLDAMVDRELAALVSTYKMLHAAPELSHYEIKTSAFFASQLRALGYTVTENVGKYAQPNWKGYGVVAMMKNGDGPTVLVRTDLDALPVEEKTGLPSHHKHAGHGKDARPVEGSVARHSGFDRSAGRRNNRRG